MSSQQTVFPAAAVAQWEAMATKILRGAAIDTLTRTDEDQLPVDALYPVVADAAAQAGAIIAPGGAVADRLTYGWEVAQPIMAVGDDAAIARANTHILTALDSGATSIMLWLDSDVADQFALLFDQVSLPAISLQLFAKDDAIAVYEKLLAYADRCGVAAADLNVSVGIDVLTPDSNRIAITAIKQGAKQGMTPPAPRHLFHLDGLEWHNRGTTAAGEIGLCLAGAAALLRAAPTPSQTASQITVTMGLPADILAGLTKIRAMRLAWAGLLDAFDIDPTAHPLFIAAMPGVRMFTVLDQDTNMLRITTALLAGALGGADRMGSWGHSVLGGETDAARRFARMTQLLLIEESGTGRTLDVAAGATALEARTDALASAGWSVMQTIEAAGGITAPESWVAIERMAATDAADRAAKLAAGDATANGRMVGVTWQPSTSPPAELDPVMATLFAQVQRPAARVEALRRAAVTHSPRIVILRPVDMDGAARTQERMVTSWLAIGGVTAIGLSANAATELTTARPDLVITLDATTAPDGYEGQLMSASDIAAATDQLAALEQLVIGTQGQETTHV